MDSRLHLLGIRHHGPGSAALLLRALDALDPSCVLIEGPSDADELIPYAAAEGMKPPLALLLYAKENANTAVFFPFAEFSPEWQAMRWALSHGRAVHFIDWPGSVSLAWSRSKAGEEETQAPVTVERVDPLDLLAEAGGYEDGESFWNSLIEQSGGQEGTSGEGALAIFAAVGEMMSTSRLHEFESGLFDPAELERQQLREAFMRIHLRQALREHEGNIAVIAGAWHLSGLQTETKLADDKARIKDLPKIKIETTWVPWTDSRLSARSGYRAGVISPGWYRHLWSLYQFEAPPPAAQFAATWQANTAALLRKEGYPAPTATAIEAARLALGLSALRELSVPGLAEMREASLATLCQGNEVVLSIIEQKLYIGERVGEIDASVPQMPLAQDLALWQKRTRLKAEDIETEIRLDLRSEAGLMKSTLLHRLNLIKVPWGRLIEADTGRGTFRELWKLHWEPELSVSLAEALVHGVTIEQAAGNATREKAKETSSITDLAELIHAALIADLPQPAADCIERLQAVAVHASDITDLMRAVSPLVKVLRYGTARKLPEEALRSLVVALSVEVNAGVRVGSHNLDQETAQTRVEAMRDYDEALRLFSDQALLQNWISQLALMVDDDLVAAPVAGLCLRRLHDLRSWELSAISAAFSRNVNHQEPQRAGAFLESFLSGGAEILMQDFELLDLINSWLCELREEDFVESLPLLRRSFSGFDSLARKRLMDRVAKGFARETQHREQDGQGENKAFLDALPLLYQILGIGESV